MGLVKIIHVFKAVLLFLVMMLIALLVVIFGIPWWGNPVLNRVFIQIFSRFTCFLLGIKLEKVDEEKIYLKRPAVFIGNHQSGLDFAFIGSISPSYSVVVGKKEIIYLPIIGWYFKVAGNLMIDRSNKKDSHPEINRLANILVEKNYTASIFPEGTRNKNSNDELLPFKKGAFHIAFAKGIPIIPVVCSSLKGIAVWERFELAGGRVIIKVLDPIETKGVPVTEMNSLIEKVRNQMQLELNQLNAQVKNNA